MKTVTKRVTISINRFFLFVQTEIEFDPKEVKSHERRKLIDIEIFLTLNFVAKYNKYRMKTVILKKKNHITEPLTKVIRDGIVSSEYYYNIF